MQHTLQKKVAIVTGGSRGIGRAVAERFGSDGASVVVTYTGANDSGQELADALRKQDSRAIAVKADVSNETDVQRLFQTAEREFGGVDIVVNAAGVSVFKPLAEVEFADFERVFAVNAKGAFFVLREASRRVRDGGRIIHFSTGGTKMPIATGGTYAASKAAGELLALSLSKELGHRQINVNVISPGVTKTEGLVMPQQALDQLIAMTPLGRLGQPVDVASAVAFLAGPDGAWVNGQVLQANGGIL
jgi:3-oxoacyl-[acyl-carrier protein] reductase